MAQTLESVYGAAGARAALAALVPVPSPTITITGTNYIQPPVKARILRACFGISSVIANFTEHVLNASHDPNYVRTYTAAGVAAGKLSCFTKHNYPMVDANGNNAIFRVLEQNSGAELFSGFYIFTSDDDRGITFVPPALPPNARWVTATVTITSVLGAWVAGAPAFNFTFSPNAKYSILGMTAQGTTLIAARLVPSAGSDPSDLRPGIPADYTTAVQTPWYQADGKPLLTFPGQNPPTIEIQAATAAAQTVLLGFLICEA